MRIVWVIAILIGVAWLFNWMSEQREAETKRLSEKPRSEQYIAGSLDRGKTAGAVMTVHQYRDAFLRYKITRNANPESLKTLVNEGYLQPGSEFDPFGQLYELEYQGREAVISSPGADRVRGTPDDIIQRVVLD